MDEFDFMMTFMGAFLLLATVAVVWAEIQFRRACARMDRELAEIDAQIMMSGFVLENCGYGGHQGRACESVNCKSTGGSK